MVELESHRQGIYLTIYLCSVYVMQIGTHLVQCPCRCDRRLCRGPHTRKKDLVVDLLFVFFGKFKFFFSAVCHNHALSALPLATWDAVSHINTSSITSNTICTYSCYYSSDGRRYPPTPSHTTETYQPASSRLACIPPPPQCYMGHHLTTQTPPQSYPPP